MNKEEFLLKLRAINRQISYMSPSIFEESFKDEVIKFDHFCWTDDAKIHTEILMKKIPLEANERRV
jgi:hypothetical protein